MLPSQMLRHIKGTPTSLSWPVSEYLNNWLSFDRPSLQSHSITSCPLFDSFPATSKQSFISCNGRINAAPFVGLSSRPPTSKFVAGVLHSNSITACVLNIPRHKSGFASSMILLSFSTHLLSVTLAHSRALMRVILVPSPSFKHRFGSWSNLICFVLVSYWNC